MIAGQRTDEKRGGVERIGAYDAIAFLVETPRHPDGAELLERRGASHRLAHVVDRAALVRVGQARAGCRAVAGSVWAGGVAP